MSQELDEYPLELLKGSKIYRLAARGQLASLDWCDCGHYRMFHTNNSGHCFQIEVTGYSCTCIAYHHCEDHST